MEVLKAHPNTQAMLDAWQRLTDGESAVVLKTEDGSIYIVMPLSRDR